MNLYPPRPSTPLLSPLSVTETDGRTPDRYIELTARRGQRDKGMLFRPAHRDASEGLVLEECELFGELARLEVVEDERDTPCGRRRAVSTEHRAAATATTATDRDARRMPHR